jgi:arylsulfatase A-like enzyme
LNENEWKRFISTYQLLIENTDRLIGQLLAAVKQKGIDDNTIIVFTTDHGEMAGSHKLIAKTTFYEESSKIPIIIKYPKIINPKTVNKKSLVGTIDIMPTLLDLAGINIPKNLDGKSFKDEIINPETESKDFKVLFSQNQFGRMVRFDNYKYVRSVVYGKKYEILFDLINDPSESENLINNPSHSSAVEKGRNILDEWLKNQGTNLITQR